MEILQKRIALHVSRWFLAVLPLALVSGFMKEYLAALLSAALHEAGHITGALTRGCLLKSVKITPAGFNATIDYSHCSSREMMFIYLCGPAVNFFLAVLFILLKFFFPAGGVGFDSLILLNICLAAINLLPAVPLDGGRLLLLFLSGHMGSRLAGRVSNTAAVVFSVICTGIGIWYFSKSKNPSIFTMGIFLLASLSGERMEAAFMNIRHILYRRSRLDKRGVYPARHLVAMKRMRLGECIKNMDYDRIHLVYVLDDDMRVLSLFTEGEIMEAMLAYNSDLTFEELTVIRNGRTSPAAKNPL